MSEYGSDAAPSGAGAPETEIEITPEMIEAGLRRLGELDGASLAYQATEVFLAMWVARSPRQIEPRSAKMDGPRSIA
jgi:hypothetical protein